ncbi:TonB-dependent receptor [Echinicola vietnamensis]|uniref:TonB-linked outer membrane protein, SusC/RagA family n=1 Tax=Echinicola vietnamensis (strain DSM 17526 / LMG 23754 / KMM 6221) TaxID=926556 RepID=L0FY86_ECHVK|nr:TonB-dependent receptor [Echinicola vietnamensis]AGA77595.1 TonB-linked outer membrane protein, SusC/RagA family [Echinicola vietnamensis DSM 17526]
MKKKLYSLYSLGRFCLVGLVLQVFLISTLHAEGYANQDPKDLNEIMVSLEANNASMEDVLATLKSKTDFSFVYNKGMVSKLEPVNMHVTNESLEQVLLQLATSHKLSFQQVNDRISVKAAETPAAEVTRAAARVTITGTVTDEEGGSLPGATVSVVGTSRGTVTDADGKYSIDVDEGETLQFSFIGFEKQQVVVGKQSVINITLELDDNSLEEVVVTGYGEVKKEHLTGAVETIDPEEFQDLPTGNLSAALAGRVLGVGVSGGNTRPGTAASLTIRNPQSFSKDGGNNSPLYVIDGVIQIAADGSNDNVRFNNLDPAEIESISFLKDASAAIYGSRGANGAVIVTTKRGRDGKPRFSYSGSYGVNDEAYRTKMLSAYDFGMYYNIMNGPNGSGEYADSEPENYVFSQDEIDHFRTINYDWLEQAWSPASNMRHNLNVSGGTDKANYFASASYFTQDGNLSTLDYDRWNFRAGADIEVADGLKAGLQVAGYYSDKTKTFNKIGGENDENDYKNLLLTPRYIPPYVNGFPVDLPDGGTGDYHFFEIQELDNLATDTDMNMSVNLFAEYEMPFLEGLKARISYGRNMGSSRGTQVGTRYRLYQFEGLGEYGHIYDGAEVSGSREYKNGDRLYYSNDNFISTQTNFTVNYANDFGQHSVSALFSIERAEAENSNEWVRKEEPASFTNGQFSSAFGEIDGWTRGSESGSLGYIGRVNYSFANKYLAEFLFRSDASTKFAPENYWGKFYSLSAGWIISNEDFFTASWIDFLKFRYSAGLLGKDDTKAWQWRQRYTFQNGKGAVFGGDNDAGIGMKMESSPNRDATWSDDFKNNFGIDARFLNSRLSATVEAFYNKGTNLLMERTGNVPVTVGGTVAAENFGEIDFFGYELSVGWNDQVGDFRYGIDGRFSWYDNKVKVSNFNEIDILYPWNAQPNASTDRGVWGMDYLGMFKSQEDIDAYVEQYDITQVFGTVVDELKPGMLYYRDVRGQLQSDGTFAEPDGIIDENDQVQLAKRESNHYGYGMTIKLGYKQFSLNAVIAGSFGGWSEYDARNAMEQEIPDSYESVPAFWGDIYDPELNPTGKFPNPYWEDISLNPRSEFWRVSGFRMAMRNVDVSYRLPKHVADKLKISSARIYFNILNPVNFYNPFSYKSSVGGSWDNYPVLRTYSLGLNLSL